MHDAPRPGRKIPFVSTRRMNLMKMLWGGHISMGFWGQLPSKNLCKWCVAQSGTVDGRKSASLIGRSSHYWHGVWWFFVCDRRILYSFVWPRFSVMFWSLEKIDSKEEKSSMLNSSLGHGNFTQTNCSQWHYPFATCQQTYNVSKYNTPNLCPMSTCKQHMTKLSPHIPVYIHIFKYIYYISTYIYISIYCVCTVSVYLWFSKANPWGRLRCS